MIILVAVFQLFISVAFAENPEQTQQRMKIAFYAEFLKLEELQKKEVVDLLEKYQLKLYIATSQEMLSSLAPILKEYQNRGIEFSLWPVLSEEDGYWVQERNLRKFSQFLDRIFEWAKENRIEVKEILVDLEPKQLKELAKKKGTSGDFLRWARKTAKENIDKRRFEKSKEICREIIEKIHSHQARATVTLSNFALEEIGFSGSTAAQDFLEAPVFGLPWDRIDFQCYNSHILERSSFSHQDLTRTLYSLTVRAKKYYPGDLSFSVGLLDPEGFSSQELLIDIEAVLAGGVSKVNVYSLDGLLKFPEPEKEIQKIFQAKPKRPKLTLGAAWFIFWRKVGWFYLRGRQFLRNL